jgi:hypothetical protein
MRILLTLSLIFVLSGCTSMLLGGPGTTYKPPQDQCQDQKEDRDGEC